jgi:hypothetical protein
MMLAISAVYRLLREIDAIGAARLVSGKSVNLKHHHPDYLGEAASALSSRKAQLLDVSLTGENAKRGRDKTR